MKTTKKLRTLLQGNEIVVAPGAHDALVANVIVKAGFEAVYMTGYGQAASHLGRPDVGLLTMTEMVTRASNMAEVCGDIPLIADADTGFGNAINVQRTVREYEKAGVAALQLEDQVAPKKCGHMMGRQVVPTEEMVGKIRAAVDARHDQDFMIIARTDARTVHGLEEALERAKRYEEAGADILFVESPESIEEMQKITSSFRVPVLANMVEGGRTPMPSNKVLEEMGYDLVIYPTASVYTASFAMIQLMNHLKKEGSTKEVLDRMVTFAEFNDLIGLPTIHQLEAKYFNGP